MLHLSCHVQRLPGYLAPWSVLLRNKMAERFASVSEDELCEKCIIKQLLNLVFAWYLTIIHRSGGGHTEVNNCFSIYHTSWITSAQRTTLFVKIYRQKPLCSSSDARRWTVLITSELANQRARKVLFTCVVYSNINYQNLVSVLSASAFGFGR